MHKPANNLDNSTILQQNFLDTIVEEEKEPVSEIDEEELVEHKSQTTRSGENRHKEPLLSVRSLSIQDEAPPEQKEQEARQTVKKMS